MKAIAFLTLLCLSASAHARIGETLDQCTYRYGSSIGHYAKDQVRFNRGHIYITVHVVNNHSVREDYAPEAGATLSEHQIEAILHDNADGHHWNKTAESASRVTLMRSDNRARAQIARRNQQNDEGRIKLTVTGAELIISAR